MKRILFYITLLFILSVFGYAVAGPAWYSPGTGTTYDGTGVENITTTNLTVSGAINATNSTWTNGSIVDATRTLPEVVVNATANLTAAQVSGTIITNIGQTTNTTATLPTAAKGMAFVFVASNTVANFFHFDPQAGDSIYLSGTSATDGKYVGTANTVSGTSIQCFTFRTGASAFDWYCLPLFGTWAAEAP